MEFKRGLRLDDHCSTSGKHGFDEARAAAVENGRFGVGLPLAGRLDRRADLVDSPPPMVGRSGGRVR